MISSLSSGVLSSNSTSIIQYTHPPQFRPTFPDTCLSPGQPGFGQVLPSIATRRRRRTQPPPAAFGAPVPVAAVLPPSPNTPAVHVHAHAHFPSFSVGAAAPHIGRGRSLSDASSHSYSGNGGRVIPPIMGAREHRRHAPYPSSASSGRAPSPTDPEAIVLAPFRPRLNSKRSGSVTLPSLASLEQGPLSAGAIGEDPLRVLARLQLNDGEVEERRKILPCYAHTSTLSPLPRLS
jgi:hypothetical protein